MVVIASQIRQWERVVPCLSESEHIVDKKIEKYATEWTVKSITACIPPVSINIPPEPVKKIPQNPKR
jgi:hypothetical protein